MKTKKRFPPSNNVISLAWSDKVSFEEILMKTGKSENEVIKIMRKELTPNSFKSWRKFHSENKNLFFNLGPDNNWKEILKKEISDEIEIVFEKEMKELGYL